MAELRCSGPPSWVLLDLFASFGDRRNDTTATCLTSARRVVQVTFEVADPPGVSRCFVHCRGLDKNRGFKGRPFILNTAGPLVLMRMFFFVDDDEHCAFDYFVYRTGLAGKPPSLDLIPWPFPKVGLRKRIGILPCGGEHYAVVFPTPRLKPTTAYEVQIFSSETWAWSAKVARISDDKETTIHEVLMHSPSKAVAAGGSSLAWIDLWRGVLLCNVLDVDPVLRLIRWPVPMPRDEDVMFIYSAAAKRDAALSNGVIRFVEQKFHYDAADDSDRDAVATGWTATMWKRGTISDNWTKCLQPDIANILNTHSSCSDLLRKICDDESEKLDLKKVSCALPMLSLGHDEDVVYFMADLVSHEALLIAVNAREETLEAVGQTSFEQPLSPCTLSSFLDACPSY